jgi:hypothetical protein
MLKIMRHAILKNYVHYILIHLVHLFLVFVVVKNNISENSQRLFNTNYSAFYINIHKIP